MVDNLELPNHIEEYINNNANKTPFIDLFEGKDIDLRTDLTLEEIKLINVIIFNDEFLNQKSIPSPFFSFLKNYLRLKVSLDRKSRTEFVLINKKDKFEDNLNTFNSFQQLKKVKE